jgi:MipA family protein
VKRGASLAVLLVLPLLAAADSKPLWEAGAGIGGLRLPAYRGSDHAQSWLLPVPYFVYRGDILRADRNGARALLLETSRFDLDLSLSASAPADSDDDPARAGMPDLKPTFEFGPKLNANLARGSHWKVDLRLPLRAVTTIERHPRHIGWTLAPVVNVDTRWPAFDLGFQAGPIYGDRRLHDHFYGVAPADATAARPAYRAPGGYAGWQATAGLSRRAGRTWFGAYLRADSVAGAVFEASPLVTARRTWSGGIAFAWIFARSGTLVSVDE